MGRPIIRGEQVRFSWLHVKVTLSNILSPKLLLMVDTLHDSLCHQCMNEWVNVTSVVKHLECPVDWKPAIEMQVHLPCKVRHMVTLVAPLCRGKENRFTES